MEKKKVKKENAVVSFLENPEHMENYNVEVKYIILGSKLLTHFNLTPYF